MLLNLSNHPSSLWQEKQTNAAIQKYGSIYDLPFPDISPQADETEIRHLAEKYLAKCRSIVKDANEAHNAVHLMGEMTFTFVLVALLQKNGIPCLASTTTREVQQNTENQKLVSFRFIRFRFYQQLMDI